MTAAAKQLLWTLRRLMAVAKIKTAQELAKLAGIDPRKVVLSGSTTFDTFEKIASVLDCKVADLVAEVEQEEAKL